MHIIVYTPRMAEHSLGVVHEWWSIKTEATSVQPQAKPSYNVLYTIDLEEVNDDLVLFCVICLIINSNCGLVTGRKTSGS
jgi:hypothetical protein